MGESGTIEHRIQRVRAWLNSAEVNHCDIERKIGVSRGTLINIKKNHLKRHNRATINLIETLIPSDFQLSSDE